VGNKKEAAFSRQPLFILPFREATSLLLSTGSLLCHHPAQTLQCKRPALFTVFYSHYLSVESLA
jgi:hypothetical protein